MFTSLILATVIVDVLNLKKKERRGVGVGRGERGEKG